MTSSESDWRSGDEGGIKKDSLGMDVLEEGLGDGEYSGSSNGGDGKRKREGRDDGLNKSMTTPERQVFRRSKKTPRSPSNKGGGEVCGLTDMIKGMREESRGRWERLENNMKEIKEELKEMRKREERWREEREEMRKRIEALEGKWVNGVLGGGGEKRLEDLERKIKELEEDKGGLSEAREGGGKGGICERVKSMERAHERWDRRERRKNVIIRGMKVKEEDIEQEVRRVFTKIGVQVGIDDWKRIKNGKEEWGDMILIRLNSEREKKKVMENKRGLKGEKIRIVDDLTWKERKFMDRLREIAREEEKKGERVWVGYKKIRIGEEWWYWDEEEEGLKRMRKSNIREGAALGVFGR